jgi:hypothetical protein
MVGKKPSTPPTRAVPPTGRGEADVRADVLYAWLVFVREDVANTVGALNDRLNAIAAAAGELRARGAR